MVHAIHKHCCADETSKEKLELWRGTIASKSFNISKTDVIHVILDYTMMLKCKYF